MKTKSSKKTVRSQIKKAVKAKKAIVKLKSETVLTTGSIAEANTNRGSRLTKEMLDKRQKAKGSVRKQGGAKITALTTQKIKTLSSQIEMGPTKAE